MALQNSAFSLPVPMPLYLAVNNLVGPNLPSMGGQGIFRSSAQNFAQYIANGQLNTSNPAQNIGIDIAAFDASGVEIVGNAYARLTVGSLVGSFAVNADGITISNSLAFSFVASTASWSPILRVGIAVTGTTKIIGSAAVTSITVTSGNQLNFPIGSFVLTQTPTV